MVVGAREDGRKELLAMELGYRESNASWAGVLRDLRGRGLAAPLLACGDGALGLWAALDEVFLTHATSAAGTIRPTSGLCRRGRREPPITEGRVIVRSA